MSKRPDGGTAFPFDGIQKPGSCEGLSVRDWFAGQALVGLCVSTPGEIDALESWDFGNIAAGAYRLADAMLAERTRSQEAATAPEGTP